MLTLDIARRLLAAAEEEAERRELRLAFALVDAGGHLVAAARMDGADWITPQVALGKAWTAAAYRKPSAAEGEKAQTLVAFAGAISAATGGRYTPQVGGLPVVVDGAPAGGMGASGATGQEDEAVVRAALDRVLGGPSPTPGERDTAALVAALHGGDWDGAPGPVELRETHISWVLLGRARALKVKKPLTLPFLDYGTAARRRALCEEEVRLNRRLAPGLYLGVRGIAPAPGGARVTDPDDPGAAEWAVEMVRWDEADTLLARLERGAADEAELVRVGARIAAFHAEAQPAGGPEAVERLERLARENFESVRERPGGGIDPGALEEVERGTRALMDASRGALAERARGGRVRDGHGDLRAEHVLLGEEVLAVDCVEFDPGMRAMDVGADLGFLVMDVSRHDQGLADALARAYREAGGDPGDAALLALFAAFRAMVRVKVDLLRADQLEPGPGRDEKAARARDALGIARRWTWRGRLAGVVALTGLSGSGKSTLAEALGAAAGVTPLGSDVARKRALGLAPEERAGAEAYADERSRAVYRRLGEEAAAARGAAGTALVEATFRRPAHREAFEAGLGAAPVYVACDAPPEILRERVRRRDEGDRRGSDAGLEVLERQLESAAGGDERPPGDLVLDASPPPGQVLAALGAALDRRLAARAAPEPRT